MVACEKNLIYGIEKLQTKTAYMSAMNNSCYIGLGEMRRPS
jgi:hypothetical protein